jgi:hypothetical protein
MKQNYPYWKPWTPLLLTLITWLLSTTSHATIYPFSATYSGSQEVPPNASTATGTITGVYNDFNNTIIYTINFSGLSSNTTAAHFHAPGAAGVSAAVMLGHAGFPLGVTSGVYSKSDVLTDAQETDLMAGLVYSNIHTVNFGPGEIRAQIILGAASPDIYWINNTYSGAQEVPPNSSPGTGTFVGAYNSLTNTIFYTITFNDLDSFTTAAHFHAPAAPGVSASVMLAHAGFPTGVKDSFYSKSDVLHDTAEAHLLAGLVYSNIHTLAFAGGEIRAQLTLMLPPVITCPADTTASNDPGLCSASLPLNATSTGIPAPTIEYTVGGTVITSPYDFPVGTTTVQAKATNAAGVDSCTYTVTVNDTEPPVLEDVEADPTVLWPPNHKMKDVRIDYTATDNCGGVITSSLSVTSNQPQNGQGDGNTEPDWEIIDDHNVKLRAERAGNGGCRIYYVKITSTDQYGNSSDSTVTVVVPHDMSGQHPCEVTTTGRGPRTMRRSINITALVNPSRTYFTFNITSTSDRGSTSVRIIDMYGRVVERRINIEPNQTIQMGAGLRVGMYIVELRQGNEVQYIRVLKID